MSAFLRMLLLTFALPTVAAAAGPVSVEFPGAEHYTDVRDRWARVAPERNLNLKELRRHVEKAAQRRLPAGETLSLRFTDIDLAGDYNTPLTGPGQDIRVVTDLYPPRLRFDWERRGADGALLAQGSESLRDFGFLIHSHRRYLGRLEYEKRLIDEWLTQTLR
ncbi:MAG: DUF3016 domain-containing protein [Xanthomonadales bacterium]|jgi:hypothetical protein|nr:DUF3016 domain-containing protein [Xanthomonadales bacterium]